MMTGHGGDRVLAVAGGREQLLDREVTAGRTRRSGGGRKVIEKNLRRGRGIWFSERWCSGDL